MPRNTPIGYVAVYNRDDGELYASWLSPYHVWLGASAGAQTYDCGGGQLRAQTDDGLGPFVTYCNARSDLP